MKKCPICNKIKDDDEFDSYYSKERQKRRLQNYCKKCSVEEKRKRAKAHYHKNKEKIKEYERQYRKFPDNKKKARVWHRKYKRKIINEISDTYVAEILARNTKTKVSVIRNNKELIKVQRAKIKLHRKLKQIKNEKQII